MICDNGPNLNGRPMSYVIKFIYWIEHLSLFTAAAIVLVAMLLAWLEARVRLRNLREHGITDEALRYLRAKPKKPATVTRGRSGERSLAQPDRKGRESRCWPGRSRRQRP